MLKLNLRKSGMDILVAFQDLQVGGFLTWSGSCLAISEKKRGASVRKCRRVDFCFMTELRGRTNGHRLTYSEENW